MPDRNRPEPRRGTSHSYLDGIRGLSYELARAAERPDVSPEMEKQLDAEIARVTAEIRAAREIHAPSDPTEPGSVTLAVAQRCRRLKKAGMRTVDIAVAMSLHRTTVETLLRGGHKVLHRYHRCPQCGAMVKDENHDCGG